MGIKDWFGGDKKKAAYRDKIKEAVARKGRDPEKVKILPGLMPIIGATKVEAQAKLQALNARIPAGYGLFMLSDMLGGIDLSAYDLDGPLPDIPDHWGVVTGQTSLRNIVGWARQEELTIRQLYERFAGARGQRTLKGSPTEIADATLKASEEMKEQMQVAMRGMLDQVKNAREELARDLPGRSRSRPASTASRFC